MEEQRRHLGPYEIRERTARRLVVERRRAVWAVLAVVGAVWLLLSLSLMPWRGGTRLFIALSITAVAAAVAALTVVLTPRQERLTVDLDAGEVRLERTTLVRRPPLGAPSLALPLGRAARARCRRRVWEDGPDAIAIRWAVELVGGEGAWRLAEAEEERPMRDLARLVAEVANLTYEEG